MERFKALASYLDEKNGGHPCMSCSDLTGDLCKGCWHLKDWIEYYKKNLNELDKLVGEEIEVQYIADNKRNVKKSFLEYKPGKDSLYLMDGKEFLIVKWDLAYYSDNNTCVINGIYLVKDKNGKEIYRNDKFKTFF